MCFKDKKTSRHLPISLERAEKIGIIFHAEDIKQNDAIIAFATQQKSMRKKIQLLGYIPKREFGFVYPFPYFTNKEINFWGIPKQDILKDFLSSSYDLLINFSTKDTLVLDYISGNSDATFKVGFNKSIKNPNYDLILIPKENMEISNLIQNLEKYLK